MPTILRPIGYDEYSALPVGRRTPGLTYLIPLARYAIPGRTYGEIWANNLSREFHDSGRTSCIIIRLPDLTEWNVDFKATDSDQGWKVSGSWPNISIHPSVDIQNSFHGWIINGIISDDLSGRVFDQFIN
jgi:hypothetical protein